METRKNANVLFEQAANELKKAGIEKKIKLDDNTLIILYSLYKQGTEGNCIKPQPSAWNVTERVKWNGWQKLHGMSKDEAQKRYINEVKTLLPSFAAVDIKQHQIQRRGSNVISTNDGKMKRKYPKKQTLVNSSRGQSSSRFFSRATIMNIIIKCLISIGAINALCILATYYFESLPKVYVMYIDDLEFLSLLQIQSPVFWFGMGNLLVLIVGSLCTRPRIQLMKENCIKRRPQAAMHTKRERTVQQLKKDPELEFIKLNGIHIIPTMDGNGQRLVLQLEDNVNAKVLARNSVIFPFTVEETADVFYRKYKEPLPDPANHLLEKITVLEEQTLPSWGCVFKKRLLTFKNAAPYLIKRFASGDVVEYTEVSLFDTMNRVFYVHIRNKSFASLGVLEELSVFQNTKHNGCELEQLGRMQIINSSVGFFRAQIENAAVKSYTKKSAADRAYHLQRLVEEHGSPL